MLYVIGVSFASTLLSNHMQGGCRCSGSCCRVGKSAGGSCCSVTWPCHVLSDATCHCMPHACECTVFCTVQCRPAYRWRHSHIIPIALLQLPLWPPVLQWPWALTQPIGIWFQPAWSHQVVPVLGA
jgi:hypothetical protein